LPLVQLSQNLIFREWSRIWTTWFVSYQVINGKKMKYDEFAVERLFQESLSTARQLLGALPVAGGREVLLP
jgi:hypothetical protein